MSVNKIFLLGNVGNNPEIKTFENDGKVANFSLATTEKGFKKKDGTEIPDRTEWHNIVVSGGLVKVVEGWVKKGTKLHIEGKIRHRSYDDKDGIKRYFTGIYVDNLELCGGRPIQQDDAPQENVNNLEDQPGVDDDLPF